MNLHPFSSIAQIFNTVKNLDKNMSVYGELTEQIRPFETAMESMVIDGMKIEMSCEIHCINPVLAAIWCVYQESFHERVGTTSAHTGFQTK